MEKKAQGAIEYLLIIGAAILVVAIVTIAITTIIGQGQSQNTAGKIQVKNSVDTLKESSGAYYKISGNYYLKSEPISSGLVGLWHFENDYNDSVDGSSTGSCSSNCPTRIDGVFGRALQVDQGRGITFPSKKLISDSFTISIWAAPINFPATGLVSLLLNPTHYWLRIDNNPTNGMYAGYWVLNTTPGSNDWEPGLTSIGKAVVSQNSWHNFVATFDGTKTLVLYIDGVPQSTVTYSGSSTLIPAQPNSPVSLYADNGSFLADELVFWNRALSADEIKQVYDNAFSK
jgi:hypothetical protein